MNEREAMGRAVELAWRGWGRVSPNPMVGAVVLNGTEPVGEGWHAEYGGPHAEAAALTAAGAAARGGTLVVTLEPCNHHGKRPPCTDAVIAAGIRRVVAALADPNPLASGGADRLRAEGVEVELGLLADQACAQNAAFLRAVQRPTRPFVALKLAASIDGKIADADGSARWISGPEAREYVQWLRAGHDAIAVGAETARRDDPALTVRGTLQPRVPPRRVVVTRSGVLPASLRLFRSMSEPSTIALSLGGSDSLTRLPQHVTVLAANSLSDGLAQLRVQGVTSLLVEGGGRLAGALVAEGLVDRLYWIQSPLWLGERAVPAFAGITRYGLSDAPRWRTVDRRSLGNDTLLILDREPCSPAS